MFFGKECLNIFNHWRPGICYSGDKVFEEYKKLENFQKIGQIIKPNLINDVSNMIIERMCNRLLKDCSKGFS